jgi:[glutamine synthetase] adenylyltransferase / [glutamine synthetase]-adenylyl-L-tyrosine phosphorylase
MEAIAAALKRAQENSPFLAQLIARQPGVVAQIAAGGFDAAWQAVGLIKEPTLAATLRKQRQAVALIAAIADLSGAWDLTRVTAALSDFADRALNMAIAAAIEERVSGAPNQGFAVIALGKHGGRELNYSSDIDPIFIFDPKTLPKRDGEDPQESAIRIGKRIIDLLGTVDENGYVFRVDMRLRPSPEISPVALPVEAAIGYYESSALAWEQSAFIRARVAAGDKELGGYFLRSIDSFIWRKSLDFGQLKNIQAMSLQIRNHYAKGQSFGPGYDLKRGRGGIRECEFFAQSHQLIHGGRNRELRIADTRQALQLLADAGWIQREDAADLSESYALLRTAEHRLQMIADQQTHSFPETEAAIDQVARLHGLNNGTMLMDLLAPHIARVQRIYDGLMPSGHDSGPRVAEGGLPLQDQLASMGFADAPAVAQRIARWRSGKLRAIRSSPARDAFENVLPSILEVLAHSPNPDQALARFDNLIEALPSAVNFFLLLEARPGLLQMIGNVLSHAPVLAEALGRRAELLDGLIDASALDASKNLPGLQDALIKRTAGLDYQSLLDQVRVFVGEQRFSLGVQLIEGPHDPQMIARGYADLAETAVRVLTAATITEFETSYGCVPGCEFIILALGRLGGGALTHASDLDLVMLFTGDYNAESDGDKPLGAAQYFNRLASRVVSALSVPTASGALYDVDTRLRPSGAQGLLCVSLDSFARYQRSEAWTWEHMALTRARVVYGSKIACNLAQKIIDDIMAMPRDTQAVLKDIKQMRMDITAHKPPKGPLDIKLKPGGLVDAEFTIHALQLLGHAKVVPNIYEAARLLIDRHALPPEFHGALALLGQLLMLVRLVAPDCAVPPDATRTLIAGRLGHDNWDELMAAIEQAAAIISAQYIKVMDQIKPDTE